MDDKIFQDLHPIARDMPESGIVELVNAGRNKEDLMPLWVGEGHLPTPDFICEAANQSLKAGHTFYTYQRGIPELRQALADYHNRHFKRADRSFSPEFFYVTGSGMQAVQLTMRALVGAGDEVIIPTPGWPNFAAAATLSGASVREVPMKAPDLNSNKGWVLDLNDLEAAITEKTRVLFINSPANPTGWTASTKELEDILAIARRHDLWVVADEVYHRFYFGTQTENGRAPSFYDVARETDKIIFINTFSKNWAMTGWRVGWIAASPALGQVFENLIQFSTSGVAEFMQRAAIAGLEGGEDFIKLQVQNARASRDILCSRLLETGRIRLAIPDGAFYLLFAIEGMDDSRDVALRLIEEANIGLSPGSAFGKGGENFLRLCFARAPADIAIASDRLTNWLAAQP